MSVLVVGAHHDDIEIGCGGTLAKLHRAGHDVYGVVLTDSATNYTQRDIHRDAETAAAECEKAASVIGYELVDLETPKSRNGCLEYDVRIMRALEAIIHDRHVDHVFMHWLGDMNTDHAVAAKITQTASRHCRNVYSYRSNWYITDRPFHETVFCDISSTFDIKKKALDAFESEKGNRGPEWLEDFLRYNQTLGRWHGVEAVESFCGLRGFIS